MSWQAVSWALDVAEIPDDDPAPTVAALVLVALAEHADETGAGAYPSLSTIARRARASESTTRRAVHRLARAGLIRRGDSTRAEHVRGDRRPQVWDLVIDTPLRGVMGDTSSGVSRGVTGDRSWDPRGVTGDAHGVSRVTPEPPMNQKPAHGVSPVTGRARSTMSTSPTPTPPCVEDVLRDRGTGSTPAARAAARAQFSDRQRRGA